MMTAKHFILLACVSCLAIAGAAPKESAQSLYDRGMAVFKVDPGASLNLLNKAAKLGHADAMLRLGHCYQTGTGTPVSPKSGRTAWQSLP